MMRKIIIPGLILVVAMLGAMTLLATSPELSPSRPEAAATTIRVLTGGNYASRLELGVMPPAR